MIAILQHAGVKHMGRIVTADVAIVKMDIHAITLLGNVQAAVRKDTQDLHAMTVSIIFFVSSRFIEEMLELEMFTTVNKYMQILKCIFQTLFF